jgi:membrane-associated PAP2 superfamily phosphatase
MGFFLMGPAFLLYRRRPRWAWFFLLLGMAGGGLLGLARVAQGQHFPSDVLWSGGLVYLSGLFLGYLFHLSANAREHWSVESVRPVIFSLSGRRREGEPSRDRAASRRAA